MSSNNLDLCLESNFIKCPQPNHVFEASFKTDDAEYNLIDNNDDEHSEEKDDLDSKMSLMVTLIVTQ